MKRDNACGKFFALLGVDFYRLFRSVSFYVVFGVYALFTLLNVLLSHVVNLLFTVSIDGEDMLPGLNDIHANTLFGNSISYGNLGLFLVIFFAIFLCSEFRENTIRNKLTLGYSRTLVYFSSLAFTYIVTAMAVVLGCAIVAAAGIPMLGWAHTAQAMHYAFYALFALLPLVALVHTLSYGSKSFGITLGVGLPVIIVLPSIMSVLSMFASDSVGIEWLTRIFFISLEEYIQLAIQFPEGAMSNLVLNVSLSYTLWTALFIVCGYFAFTRQDIK